MGLDRVRGLHGDVSGWGGIDCDANILIFFVLVTSVRVLIIEGDLLRVFGLGTVLGFRERRDLIVMLG